MRAVQHPEAKKRAKSNVQCAKRTNVESLNSVTREEPVVLVVGDVFVVVGGGRGWLLLV